MVSQTAVPVTSAVIGSDLTFDVNQYIHVVTTREQSHNFNGVAGIAIEDDKATEAIHWFRPDVQQFAITGHESPCQLGVLAQQTDRRFDSVNKPDGRRDILVRYM